MTAEVIAQQTTTVLGTKTVTEATTANGQFSDNTINFTVAGGATEIGDNIRIRFSTTGQSVTQQSLVDNLTLTLVPEPSTSVLLFGLIAVGICFLKHR